MNLGPASLQLELAGPAFAGTGHVHGFEVQEFRRPEFEVKAAASEGPYVSGGAATVTVSAAYYAGGALPGAEVSWRVAETPGSYRPPNREDFVFGVFVPWWLPLPEWHGAPRSATFAARTDASGEHRLRVDFDPQEPPRPRVVTAEATVMDVNRQAWTAIARRSWCTPACATSGCAPSALFVQQGEPLVLDAIATDLDGRAVAARPGRAARGAAGVGAGRRRVEGGGARRAGPLAPLRQRARPLRASKRVRAACIACSRA